MLMILGVGALADWDVADGGKARRGAAAGFRAGPISNG